MRIPFSPPDISEYEIAEVAETLRSGWITTGPKTKIFEKKIAEYSHTSIAVCLNSATACMEIALRLLGVGPGDEVITSAYTYTASASVIYHVGARIVLVDTAPNSYQMDYAKMADAITEKTKAIIPVDIGGVMCDYDKIFDVVERKRCLFHPNNDLQKLYGRVIVIADAAHSFGSRYKCKHSGEVADFTSFSFHAVKNLTTAEGGAITWRDMDGLNNEELYYKFMLLSLHGQSMDALAKTKLGAWEYDVLLPAYKCNMTDIMAAIGLAQISRFDMLMARRKEIIESYDSIILPIGVQRLDHSGGPSFGNGHLYMTRTTLITEQQRNELIKIMAAKGIATSVHFKPLPLMTAYKNLGFTMKDYPNAYAQYANEISLPIHTLLSDEEVIYIGETFRQILEAENILRSSKHLAVNEIEIPVA